MSQSIRHPMTACVARRIKGSGGKPCVPNVRVARCPVPGAVAAGTARDDPKGLARADQAFRGSTWRTLAMKPWNSVM